MQPSLPTFHWAETLTPEYLKSPWWIGHIPFAFELIGRLKPSIAVELGTYSGSSFAAFCQAVKAGDLNTRCYGVDLWAGDVHMGKFDDALYVEIATYIAKTYPNIGSLIRKNFNDAVHDFADGSIDLLHIDGTHTYEAVSNDFHTWKSKLSDRSVVLFHDVNVNEQNTGPSALQFGVRRFFNSIRDQYPHCEFLHCWGLGVLITGKFASEEVLGLIDAAKSPNVSEYFAQKGAAVSAQYESLQVPLPNHGTYYEPTPEERKVKLIALYFPQLHAIPENDEWWGKGFTDWVNVKKARPQFDGHYQPRVPAENRYYDQSQLETLQWQISLAKKYGVGGFCHYHYWFEGKQLLETPTNLMLENKELDLPFCLAWANETWSRRWDGLDHHILQEQTHRPDPAMWAKHFEYLYRAWSDPRAIKIDGKPVFLIYRPHRIEKIGEMFALWRKLALERGLQGLYFVAMKQFEYPVPSVLEHFDASMHFQPFEALYSPDFGHSDSGQHATRSQNTSNTPIVQGALLPWYLQPLRALPAPVKRALAKVRFQLLPRAKAAIIRRLRRAPERLLDILRAIRYKHLPSLTFYDYDPVWQQILKVERDGGLPTFPGAFVDWDNTARYANRARIFRGASPERFSFWFKKLVETTATRPYQERHIFLNAWNEWAEGTYLEPDNCHGYRYLEAVKSAMDAHSESPENLPSHN